MGRLTNPDAGDDYMDSLADIYKPRHTMNFENVLVPAPTAKAIKPIKTHHKERPFWALHVPALRKWFCDKDLSNVVADFLNEVEHGNGGFGYGASEIGGQNTLYTMMTVSNKKAAGTVSYNGTVKLDEVLS